MGRHSGPPDRRGPPTLRRYQPRSRNSLLDTSLPQISVIIPTRNRINLLGRTLASVLAQRDVELEVIIVDDGSTDGTADALLSLEEPRIRIIHHATSQGVSMARNAGARQARGEWIAFLDDDDVWADDKLSSQLALAVSQGRRWAYSGSVAIASDSFDVLTGSPPSAPEEAVRWLPWRNTVLGGASSVMARRDLLDEAGGFDASLRHMADWDMWIRLARHGGVPAVVPRPLLGYAQHPSNASGDIAAIPEELMIMEERYSALRDGAPADRAYVYRWMAWNSIRSGRRFVALRCYALAVREGDLRSILRMIVTALHPSIARWVRNRQRPSGEWKEAAEDWLRSPYGEALRQRG